VFGEGTYLSSDIGVCMNFTKGALVWARSRLGEKLACVCVCEVVDHPRMFGQSLAEHMTHADC
jgi:poly[ADP-ribose] polymerase 16